MKIKKGLKIFIGISGIIILLIIVLIIINSDINPFRKKEIKWTSIQKRAMLEQRLKELKKEIKENQNKTVGMTDKTRKQIFWDLIELQDSFLKKYPYDTQKQQEAYKIIANKYDVLEYVVRQIAIRGVKEGWSQPPLK